MSILESKIEEDLVSQLERLGWKYESNLRSEESLWQNIKQIIEENNQSKIKGSLSEAEFAQVKEQLVFPTIKSFNDFLIGENGVCTLVITLDNFEKVALTILDTRNPNLAKYQVINQCKVSNNYYSDSRFDVTLLINGLPITQIELKKPNISYFDAFHQIDRYSNENKYEGVFSTIRAFIVSNYHETAYFPNQNKGYFTRKQLVNWKDSSGNEVNNLVEFTNEVLDPEFLFDLVTKYFLYDSRKNTSVILRPYQVQAVKQIEQAILKNESGYVWHTTGSGKTLTSFCTSMALTKLKDFDKTIFIVDRIDLDQQTISEFTAFSDYDFKDLNTENTGELLDKLLIKGNQLVVTTIQKLTNLVRHQQNIDEIKHLRLLFVVDECHRAVSFDKKEILDSIFENSLWYGFTGTPIFKNKELKAEGRKSLKGFEYTTETQYGYCLHKYTIQNAIADNSVLGFKTNFIDTFSDEDKKEIYARVLEKDKESYDLTSEEFEFLLKLKLKTSILFRDVIYGKQHKLKVLDTIVNHSENLFGMQRPLGNRFSALLTTSSIDDAMTYYELLQEFKAGTIEGFGIDTRIKQKASEFPKFAITFSLDENQEHSIGRKIFMENVLNKYNQEFNKHFTLDTLKQYNEDINRRLSRKEQQFSERSEQLDLVIVVNRLLTGFDAPMVSTLFIDRKPLEDANLIQAMSRTNRTYQGKNYGNIVGFREPFTSSDNLNKALILYADDNSENVLAISWEMFEDTFIHAVKEFNQKYPTPAYVAELKDDSDKFSFLKDFIGFDNLCKNASAYMEYDKENEEEKYGLDSNKMEQLYVEYLKIKKYFSKQLDKTDTTHSIDLNYEIESIFVKVVDQKYIVNLIEIFIARLNKSLKNNKAIDMKELIMQLKKPYEKNEKLLKVFEELIQDIEKTPKSFEGRNITKELEKRVKNAIRKDSEIFANAHGFNPAIVSNLFLGLEKEDDLSDSKGYQSYKYARKESFAYYKERSIVGCEKSLISFNTFINKQAKEYFDKEISPYKEFKIND